MSYLDMLYLLFIFKMSDIKFRLDSINEIALICTLADYHKKFTGYSLIKDMSIKLNKNVSSSLIYPLIKRLEALKYIRKIGVGNRRKNFYIMTLKGRIFCNKTKHSFIALSKRITRLGYRGGIKITNKNKKKIKKSKKSKVSKKKIKIKNQKILGH